MNTSMFSKKTSKLQCPRLDRFVLPRETFADIHRRASNADCQPKSVNIWEAKLQKQKKYKTYLDEVLGLDIKKYEDEVCMQPWPCAPRKKGFLSSADSILDLPTYSYATFPEILDWSVKNILVAALGVSYYKFNWNEQAVMGQGVTQFHIHCCKFDPKGDLLLIGTHKGAVEAHDAETGKLVHRGACKCTEVCDVTAIDWSPTGNSFITGCDQGVVCSFSRRSLQRMHCCRLANAPRAAAAIRTVRVSPDARYVAVVAFKNPLVYLLLWPSLQYHSSLDSSWNVRTIAWHPWRSALLGVGIMAWNSTIAVWDTPSARIREVKLGAYNQYTLDVMLFSHLTGELVFSVWNSERAATFPKTCSQLVVMSDEYTVVDQSGESRTGLERVRTMVFSPDGTKLATATADEDLIIWNFLPENKNVKIVRTKRFSAMPVYLDEVSKKTIIR